MRKYVVPFMACLLSCSAVSAFWPEAVDSSLEMGFGYRRDKFNWETKSDTFVDAPTNVSSNLTWRDLNIWQIRAAGKYVTCEDIYFRGYIDYGWITHGKVIDSDFISAASGATSGPSRNANSNLESSEFRRSTGKSKKGHTYDTSIAAGYLFRMCCDTIGIAPVVGYSWHGQHLNIRKFNQITVNTSSSSSGLSDNARSKYNARWNGPFIGVDLDYKFYCDWTLLASYEYHFAKYHAKGHWHLRPDLIDGFNHRASNADGQVANIGIKWDFCECWTLGLIGQWQWFQAKHGHDKARINQLKAGDNRTDCFLTSPLKRVNWRSASINIDVGLVF
ncbi:MAG: hypothetical protein H0W88_06035 [Parachlamydiaceae bacterium]|nr:hypothetical protein [Parachlamydiaceae bacterium]